MLERDIFQIEKRGSAPASNRPCFHPTHLRSGRIDSGKRGKAHRLICRPRLWVGKTVTTKPTDKVNATGSLEDRQNVLHQDATTVKVSGLTTGKTNVHSIVKVNAHTNVKVSGRTTAKLNEYKIGWVNTHLLV